MNHELLAPEPLSAEDAYWHACTGTPYVPKMLPVVWDKECPYTYVFTFHPGSRHVKDVQYVRRSPVAQTDTLGVPVIPASTI